MPDSIDNEARIRQQLVHRISRIVDHKLLADSGFFVNRIRHFNLRDNGPALVSSVFPSLDPVSRSVRHRKRNNDESRPVEWLRHLTYLLLVTCAYPVVLLESAFGCGATIMIEAKKK